ncbi:hypothetical protein CHUAL_009732 [Chamberlinius hualienensis]
MDLLDKIIGFVDLLSQKRSCNKADQENFDEMCHKLRLYLRQMNKLYDGEVSDYDDASTQTKFDENQSIPNIAKAIQSLKDLFLFNKELSSQIIELEINYVGSIQPRINVLSGYSNDLPQSPIDKLSPKHESKNKKNQIKSKKQPLSVV